MFECHVSPFNISVPFTVTSVGKDLMGLFILMKALDVHKAFYKEHLQGSLSLFLA